VLFFTEKQIFLKRKSPALHFKERLLELRKLYECVGVRDSTIPGGGDTPRRPVGAVFLAVSLE